MTRRKIVISVELLEKLKTGDNEAFTEFYKAQYPRFIAHFRKNYGFTHELAQDAWQELCLRFYKHIMTSKPDKPDGLKKWLVTVANHIAIDVYRKSKHDENYRTMVEAHESMMSSFQDMEDPENTENVRIIRDILFEVLDEIDLELIKFFYWYDCTYRNLADDFDIRISTLKSRMKRIREKIRKEFLKRKGDSK
jgi:RNA polymerase sigma factor (sigma-70 family)